MRNQLGLVGFVALLLGCASHSCRRDPAPSSLKTTSAESASAESKRAAESQRTRVLLDTAKQVITVDLKTLLRSRKFKAALRVLEGRPAAERRHPQVRFIEAYLAQRTTDAARAITLLEGLETDLPELTTVIGRLRAEAQLETVDALKGAAQLTTTAEPSAWIRAAQTLERLGRTQEVLIAVERGLLAENGGKGTRAEARRVKLHELSLRALETLGRGAETEADARFLLGASVPSETAERLFEKSLDALPKGEARIQIHTRLGSLAERGRIESLERCLTALSKHPEYKLPKATALALRGRARLIARRESEEGAKLLLQAAELGPADAAQLRLDAARLWVRLGNAAAATQIYEKLAAVDPRRAEEALYYAARAEATLGDSKKAETLYASLLRRFPKGRKADVARYEQALNWMALGQDERARSILVKWATDPSWQSSRAVLTELAGLAAERAGKVEEARSSYESVLQQFPHELASVFARARLAQLGAPWPKEPPAPKAAAEELDPTVEPVVQLFLQWGLDELAADAYREQERREVKAQRPRMGAGQGRRTRRAQCGNWSLIAYGPEGFAASRELRATVLAAKEVSSESRWAFDCRFPRPYQLLVAEAESRYALPKDVVFAIMRQESSFDPNVVSPASAKGLLQLLEETARRTAANLPSPTQNLDFDLFEPRDNVELGAAYLRQLLDWFKGDLLLTVAAYNAGPAAVKAWVKAAAGLPPELFAARIPYAETRGYVERVLGNLSMYRYLQGGNEDLPFVSLDLRSDIDVPADAY